MKSHTNSYCWSWLDLSHMLESGLTVLSGVYEGIRLQINWNWTKYLATRRGPHPVEAGYSTTTSFTREHIRYSQALRQCLRSSRSWTKRRKLLKPEVTDRICIKSCWTTWFVNGSNGVTEMNHRKQGKWGLWFSMEDLWVENNSYETVRIGAVPA